MNYHKITYPDQNNGDGLRVVLWLSGCDHYCKECQNPQTWKPNSGVSFDDAAKEELFRELNKDYISGLTLSGGDPLYKENLNDVLHFVNEIRLLCPKKTIWLYTGYCFEECIPAQPAQEEETSNDLRSLRYEIVKNIDVLIDGQYIKEQRDLTLKWRGSKNQRVIDVQKSLRNGEVILWAD